MTIAELQREFLAYGDQRIAPEDFFILLSYALEKDKVFILSHPEYSINSKHEERARSFFSRRVEREPVAFILGHKEFYGIDFTVTQNTLIPRPETEMLVDLALEEIKKLKMKNGSRKKISVIDVGTGSGNIIISVVKTLKNNHAKFDKFEFYGIDNFSLALKIARYNAKKHKVDKKIKFLKGNLLKPFTQKLKTENQKLKTIILANLPYLSHTIYAKTAKDVRDFEPKDALVSKQNGLAHYYRLLKSLKDIPHLPQVTLFLEISPEQKFSLKKYIATLFPDARVVTKKDLAGKERVFEIRTTLS